MSDATFDASTFVKIPFTESDFSNLLYINRTNLGWKFFNKNKKIFYYYEPKGEVFSISPPFFSELKISDDVLRQRR